MLRTKNAHDAAPVRRLAVLAALVALGIALELLGIVDWRLALEWARGHAGGRPLAAAIVAAQLVLYTFAQPGSLLLWVAALLYAPPAATLILTAGGAAGATSPADLMRLEVLGPPILIALLLLPGRLLLRQAARKRDAPP